MTQPLLAVEGLAVALRTDHGLARILDDVALTIPPGGSLGVALRSALPSMPAFAALFGSPEITALAWVHLVLLDLVQAR